MFHSQWKYTRLFICLGVVVGTITFLNDRHSIVYGNPLDLPPAKQLDSWDSSKFVVGSPNKRFRDNLRADKHYITSWNDAGFTNQFMSYVNLIYLGMLSDRVPIIAPFAPFHHVPPSAGILPFGEIFNLTFLRSTLRLPVLEWSDVKRTSSPRNQTREPLGCWSTWTTSDLYTDPQPRRSDPLTSHLSLDVSYTPVPPTTRRFSPDSPRSSDWYLLFNPLSALIYPRASRSIDEEAPFPSELGSHLPPDEHLSCFDLMYFVSAGKDDFEWNSAWCPAWRFIGRHLRFNESLVEIAKGYVRRLMNGEEKPFISVHVRRGDFGNACDTPGGCFAPLSAYKKQVRQVQVEILRTHGVRIPDSRVIVMSDEVSPDFWREARALGWKNFNHDIENTVAIHGEWYVTVIEVVVQSLSIGFVGTDRSTMSVISQKRVEDWNKGSSRLVLWL